APEIQKIYSDLKGVIELGYKDIIAAARRIKHVLVSYPDPKLEDFENWLEELTRVMKNKISSHLYTVSKEELIKFKGVPPEYTEESSTVDGRVIIRDNFDALLKKHDNLILFGEDVGKIGDVNQGLEGLQKKYGELRISDTGIREATIAGQGIGLALRGLRPIAEIQYLDYILYCIQILSDDLATMSYRTVGQQIAPLIIRTRGHRLEGIWHSGSPMGGMMHLLRGIHLLVPRNMTQAAGFYNTLLEIEQPAIVVESLNGYRLKEQLPSNLGAFFVPLGQIEVLREGSDLTAVSYGSTLRILEAAAKRLSQIGIEVEVIDAQSLIPFDLKEEIRNSIAKTSRLLIVDEDVPGGASSYILQQLIEKQGAFSLLDSSPVLLSAKAHRPAYGGDGDYFSKPSEDDIFEAVYAMMHETDPNAFPL
ncbi:MAG: alpha-ketoacid dehydrogenase subunit beta, partial [Flavobacteriaceae bacterium]